MNINEFTFIDKNEKPLDNLVFNGGCCSVFKRICIIGDSLSAGEFEAKGEDGNTLFFDCFDYSWGAYIHEHTGSEVLNFSRGGMTAKEYYETFAEEKGFWNKDKLCQAYIIALGVNDLLNARYKTGDIADVCFENRDNNADTFAGYLARIMQKIKSMQPEARFFLVSIPRGGNWNDPNDEIKRSHRDLLKSFCDNFTHTYLIDLFAYAPVYDRDFYDKFFFGGHMSPVGYYMTAIMIESYIDHIIRHDPSGFRNICFIGTEYEKQ